METLRDAHEWTEGMWKPQPPPMPTKVMRSASLPQLPSPELKGIGSETFLSTGIMGEESPCLPASEAGTSDIPLMTPSSPAMTPSRPLRDRSEVGLYALCATERLATPHIKTWNTCTTDSRASFTLHLSPTPLQSTKKASIILRDGRPSLLHKAGSQPAPNSDGDGKSKP